jgi:hypothetical protein
LVLNEYLRPSAGCISAKSVLGWPNPTGKISELSSLFCKNILIYRIAKSAIYHLPSRSSGGAFRDRHDTWGGDAVDVDAPLTNGVEADGEDVWS